MNERDKETLEEMLLHARQAVDWARAQGTAWTTDAKTVAAVALAVGQIGEGARRVSKELREAAVDVPWSKVVGTRNRIYHDYLHIDLNVLASIVDEDLPGLIREVEAALAQDRPR